MKVLSAPPMTWTSKVSCNNCSAQLEVELSDLKRVTDYDQRSNESWDYVTFQCPVCERVSSSEPLLQSIPLHLRDNIPLTRN